MVHDHSRPFFTTEMGMMTCHGILLVTLLVEDAARPSLKVHMHEAVDEGTENSKSACFIPGEIGSEDALTSE
jgi:hypothetical protein